jgi:four helix bundle protein
MIRDLEDFNTYNFAMELGEEVLGIVIKWNYFEKDTIGKQLVKAVDSIAANLSEGLGRYHYKEAKNFSFCARGSLFETQTWITKAYNRKLMEEKQFVKIKTDLDIVGRMINKYIKSIGTSNRPDETDENTSPNT